MLSKITRRTVADEARDPTLNVLMRARDQRWNWLGHILPMDEDCPTRRVLLECVPPTPESLYGDVPKLDIAAATKIAKDRIGWKKLRPSKRY